MIIALLQRIYNAMQSWRQLIRTNPVILLRQLRKAAYIERLKKEATIPGILNATKDDTLLKKLCYNNNLARKVDKLFLSKQELTENLLALGEESKQKIIADANKICEHEVNLLSDRDYNLGKRINWLQDYKSGRVWPLDFYSDIIISYPDNSDIKVPWELSRFYHIPMLVGAFFITNNRKYLDEIISQINDWMDSNPPYFGPNWACPMEAAIRICNWSWFWGYLGDQIEDKVFVTKFLNTIWYHGDYIFNNLELGYFTSNHYLSDVAGLVFLGIVFPEFKQSKKWLRYGVTALEREMRSQVTSEGVDFEASTSYHRLVLELFLYPALLCRAHDVGLSKKFWNRLEKMFQFVKDALKPNGEIPQFGDNDNGRIYILQDYYGWNVLDHRYLLVIGAILFDRPDFKLDVRSKDIYSHWLFGKKKIEKYESVRPHSAEALEVKVYKRSGYIFVKNTTFYFATAFAGNGGKRGMGGHGHNNVGNFELQIDGRDLVVDPGTGNYTGDSILRNFLRSQRQHNTLTIDNIESNYFEKNELFQFREYYKPELTKIENVDRKIFITINNVAYEEKLDIKYTRQFQIDPIQKNIVIQDNLCNLKNKRYVLYWNYTLAPMVRIISLDDRRVETDSCLFTFDGNYMPALDKAIYSASYGLTAETSRLFVREEINNIDQLACRMSISFKNSGDL